MSIAKRQDIRCAFCKRTLSEPRVVHGIGHLGPECYSKVAGLEPMLAYAAEARGTRGTLHNLVRTLEGVGLKVRLVDAGEDERGFSLYRVRVVGASDNEAIRGRKEGYLAQFAKAAA